MGASVGDISIRLLWGHYQPVTTPDSAWVLTLGLYFIYPLDGGEVEADMSEQGFWNFELGELPFREQLFKTAVRLTRSSEDAED